MIKYAFARDLPGEHTNWTLKPWYLRGMRNFDTISQVPTDHVLVVSHYAPWWSPLREYINQGRPWIEIEYGYWGPDTPRRETRRVTYRNYHNLNIQNAPHSRTHLFPSPEQQPWRQLSGQYIIGIQPVEVVLQQRTGENLVQFRQRLEKEIRKYSDLPIHWRKKYGAKTGRFSSFVEQLQHAHAVVGERTMACVESCLMGVPAYTVDTSMTTLLMGGIENLANIQYPDRSAWWEHICWSQFNRAEFETPTPADLVEQYQILGH